MIIASFRDLVKHLLRAEGIDAISDPSSAGGQNACAGRATGSQKVALGAESVIEHP